MLKRAAKISICCIIILTSIISAKSDIDIQIIEPIPGSKLLSGDIINITWNSPPGFPIDLFYSYDDIEVKIASGLTGSTYQWEVPYLNSENLTIIARGMEYEQPSLIWHQPNAHIDEVYSIAFSEDRKRLITSGKDNKVKIWDIPSKSLLHEFVIEHGSLKQAVFFLDDGFVAVSDSLLIIYDLLNDLREEVLASDYNTTFRNVAYTDINTLIAVGTDNGKVYLFHPNGSLVDTFESGLSSVIYSVRFGRDGSKILFTDYEGWIHIGSINDKSIISRGTHGTNALNAVVWSADTDNNYNKIISGSVDLTVRIWDYNLTNHLASFNSHNRHVRSVRISADGKRAVSGALDNIIRQYDVENFTEFTSFTIDHGGSILGIDITPDTDTIASAGRDNSFKLWKNFRVLQSETSEDYELENDLYIQIPDKLVLAGTQFALPVFSNISKVFRDFRDADLQFNIWLQIPILIMEPIIGITVPPGQIYEIIKFNSKLNFVSENIFEFTSLALNSYIDRDSVRIIDFEVEGHDMPEIKYLNGLVQIIYDCEGDYGRRVFVGGEHNNIVAYPNPGKDDITITVELIESAIYKVSFVNLRGEELLPLHNGFLKYGTHKFFLNLTEYDSGAYFVIVSWGENNLSTKVQIRK